MVLRTGSASIGALWASLFFLAEIIVITGATRTISLGEVARFYCLGGAMMSVMFVIASVFTSFVPDPDAVSRQFLMPLCDESLKFAPVVFLLWRYRDSRLRTMGASDVLLMAAASGAGYGLVEEAYIRNHPVVHNFLDWLPIARVNGIIVTIGHGGLTSVSGAALGLALLWRPRRPFFQLLAAAGFLCAWFDHSQYNYAVDRSGFSVDLFNFIAGHGWNTLYLLVISVIAVVASDFYAVRRMLSSHPQLKLQGGKPPESSGRGVGFKVLWAYLVERRALAYALFRCGRSSGTTQQKFARLASGLERRMLKPPSWNPALPDKPPAASPD